MRGRTAIQSVDMELWKAVEANVYACSKFIVHVVGPIKIKLRDDADGQEPTLMCYQSDLCQTLANELERRWKDSGRLNLHYDCQLKNINLDNKFIETANSKDSFDLVVGCDGVNSIVRQTIHDAWPDFQSIKTQLPNRFKSAQLAEVPPKLDPSAVSALLPKSGKITAAVEPTARCCCVLFQGPDPTDRLLTSTDADELEQLLRDRYPLLDGGGNGGEDNFVACAQQLAAIPSSFQASSVQCNIYHYGTVAALCGDAAHATVGQGMNAALEDSVHLADCLLQQGTTKTDDSSANNESLHRALLQYSQSRVPEGWALQ